MTNGGNLRESGMSRGVKEDLTGRVFNRLSVLGFYGWSSPTTPRAALWLCQCACGNQVSVRGNNLKRGSTRSCGCLQKDFLKTMKERYRLPPGESALNSLYKNYMDGAIKRGHAFDLSKEDFKSLTKGNCTYCGKAPTNVYKNTTTSNADSGYLYNGVDRVDNKEGYTKTNSVPCCSICNKMKGTLSVEEFYTHMLKIIKRKGYDNV